MTPFCLLQLTILRQLLRDDFEGPLLKGTTPRCILTALISAKMSHYAAHRPRYRVRIPPDWLEDDNLLTDREFKALYRMDHASFYALLDRIAEHEVFISTSARPQRPAKFQLQVMLFHFGGSGGSRLRTSLIFQIAETSVSNYVGRVMTAILSLQAEFLRWPEPNSNAYKTIVRRHQLEYGFPNVLGFVDGTLIPTYRKPVEQGESYYTRKSSYAIHTTLIVDSTTRVLFVSAGRTILIDLLKLMVC
jgi:hypothetical protein